MSFNVPPARTDRATFPTSCIGKAFFLILAGYAPTEAGSREDDKLYFRFGQEAGAYNTVYNLFQDAVMDAKNSGKPLNAQQLVDKADEIWSEMEAKFGGQRM